MDFTDNSSKQILSWFCCNCGTKVSAIKTVDGFYKAKCSRSNIGGCWKMRLPLMLEKSKICLKYTYERLTKWVNSDEPN